MFILYFALWVVLNGKWTTEIAVFGLVFAAVIYLFTWKYMGFGPKLDAALIKRFPSAVSYGVTLLLEIVKANITVCRMILREEVEVKPQLVRFDVDLKKNRHLVALANSITLTPGTITVNLEDNHFTVHALDASMVDGLDDGVFVQALQKMEIAHGYAAVPCAAEDEAKEEAAEAANEAADQEPQDEEPTVEETAVESEEEGDVK